MSDLINRQDAIDALCDEYCGGWQNCKNYPKCENLKAIQKLPSAQPETIRCKDCKYASPNGKYGCKAYHFKLYETHSMYADDYCSRAERRTDE